MTDAGGSEHYRMSRPELFMNVAELTGLRGTCPRASVGVTATRDNRIIASGYVGAPSGMPHCAEVGCLMENGHCIRSIHAEANMISWAAREGIPLRGATIWCTIEPCFTCAKLLVNIAPEQVVYQHTYGDGKGTDLLMNLDIPVVPFEIMNQR